MSLSSSGFTTCWRSGSRSTSRSSVDCPPVEVLNELRYALRAAVELLVAQGIKSDGEIELRARIHHALLCAYHDLVDGLVIEIPKLLDELRLKFPISSREVAGPRLIEIMSHIEDAKSTVKESRGNPDTRRKTYEELYTEWFDQLLGDFAFARNAQFDIAEHQQSQKVTEEENKATHRAAWRRIWIALPISLVVGWIASDLWEYLQSW